MNRPRKAEPPLRAVQQHMAALILSGTPDSSTPEGCALDAWITVPPRGSVDERLHVYAGGYPARLEEALNESFPAVAHVLGDGAFHGLVHRYSADVPLHSYNLTDAGAELPRFLRDDQLTTDLPFLPDLARLEWHVGRAFHAHDRLALETAALATWSLDEWESAVMRFQPWVALVTADWPIREIWECRETPIEEIDLDMRNRGDRVLVRRAGYAVLCESLDDAEAHALGALLGGETLGAVIAALAERGEDPAAVSALFARWTSLGMITDCTPAAR